ncbi:MAG: RNA polymerase subunit sigma-70 [Pirellulales bacterium]|nr:RNA polymerase subunit sigma-70 [Pirellulales bacterium]
MAEDSVSDWLGRLKAGDPAAAEQLWERYFPRLMRLAQRRLETAPRRAADEEDAALSAFHSFCRGIKNGRFPQLADRNDLWRLLAVITCRKALKQLEAHRRQKRGGGRLRGESVFFNPDADSLQIGIDGVPTDDPTPAFEAQLSEEFDRLLDRLEDESLRRLALLKLEGFSNEEIAAELQCGLRTVERRLRGIRAIWNQEENP